MKIRPLILSLFATTLSLHSAEDPAARDAALWKASKNPKTVASGKESFTGLCQSCHGDEKAKGDAPSNLFDTKWYHGGMPHEIETTIREGFLEKAMPPWKDALAAEDIEALVAYLLSFQPAPKSAAK